MKKYYPILVAKKGEIAAIRHLEQDVKDEVSPIIELLPETLEKKVRENEIFKNIYRDEFEMFLKAHWNFFDNQVIIDFSLLTEEIYKIADIKKMCISLLNSGVNIVPTIQNNSSDLIKEIIKNLVAEFNISCCIRIGEKSGGLDNFKNEVDGIINFLNIPLSRTIILIDLGYIKNNSNMLVTICRSCINSLDNKNNYNHIIIASGSFPENLGEFEPRTQPYKLERLEWSIWERIKTDFPFIKYSDFGTKHPHFEDVSYAGTVSLKYTTKDFYIVYKGKKTDKHEHGHGQYVVHAFNLRMSGYYSGEKFSWGDLRTKDISEQDFTSKDKRKTGNHTTWIEISQNHHITLLHSLL